MPEPPVRPSPTKSSQSDAATYLAMIGILVIAAALLGLTALVLPFVQGLAIVALLFVAPITFHYVVWGWWLSQMKDDGTDDEE